MNIEQLALQEFENVGDEGLFPNHSDKDIWLSGFFNCIDALNIKSRWDESILNTIFNNGKVITEYYVYPTGGYGEEIASTNNWSGNKYDYRIKNFVDFAVQIGAAVSGKLYPDNKTAVKIEVDGLNYPIYCYRYDGLYSITKNIVQRDGVSPIKIRWIMGY